MSARASADIRGAFVVTACLLASGTSLGGETPREWLERTGHAVEALNYSGTLVHLNGEDASVLRIVHRVDNGQVTEKITSQDAGREIIRDDDAVTCIFPDQRVVLVEGRDGLDPAQSPLQGRLPGAAGISDTFYHLAFAGTERIAGRDTRVIAIRPKDGYRYGYRVWVDRATAIPMKTQLLDDRGTVLEQVLFSEINLPKRIPPAAVRSSLRIDSFAVRRAGGAPDGAAASGPAPTWGATQLPSGFGLAVHRARPAPLAGGGLSHLVYSDGLATVSVFIEPAVAASEQAEGLSQIGAANAFTTVQLGHMVTAVGEVPARTVVLIAQSARPLAVAGARPEGVSAAAPAAPR
jgi:sigma-E factor negative regulatory protein RseB